MTSSVIRSKNSDLLQLFGVGLLGGLIGAGFTVLLMDGGRTSAPSTVESPSFGTELGLIHRDLEKLIELQERAGEELSTPRAQSQREGVATNDPDPGLVAALAQLDATMREVLERPIPTSTSSDENTSLESVGRRPPNHTNQLVLFEEFETDPVSVLDCYFGVSMARIYELLGRPSDVGASDSGVYWRYYEIGGDKHNHIALRFYDGIVIDVDN